MRCFGRHLTGCMFSVSNGFKSCKGPVQGKYSLFKQNRVNRVPKKNARCKRVLKARIKMGNR